MLYFASWKNSHNIMLHLHPMQGAARTKAVVKARKYMAGRDSVVHLLSFTPWLMTNKLFYILIVYFKSQGAAGPAGITGVPGTKGEMVRDIALFSFLYIFLSFLSSLIPFGNPRFFLGIFTFFVFSFFLFVCLLFR